MNPYSAIKTVIIVLLSILPFHNAYSSEITWTTFPTTVYYFSHLSGPGAPYDEVTFHITAVDEYSLYVNGARIDDEQNDGNWRTVEEYTTVIGGSDIIIAVEVTNHGIGSGNGLMIDIEAGSDLLGTTTSQRMAHEYDGSLRIFPSAWYYAGWDITDSLEQLTGGEWYKLGYDSETGKTILDDPDIVRLLPRVLPGWFNGATDYISYESTVVVTGYRDDVDTGGVEGGGIQLRSIDGENIAFGKPAQAEGINDGNVSDTYYSYTVDPTGSSIYIDLERIYRIQKVMLYTGGSDPGEWENLSVRGWAAEISLDNYRWEEVNVIHEVGITNEEEGGHNFSQVTFPDEWARYVRYRIIDTRDTFPAVGEVMVYGIGFDYDGKYESPWIDFGEPDTPKYIGTISWEGNASAGTGISLQTKLLVQNPDGTLEQTDWSERKSEQSFTLDTSRPVIRMQYRVILTTQDIFRTPVLKSLSITYDTQVNVDTVVPEQTALLGVVPNPFNAETVISFRVGSNSPSNNVRMLIYSMNGQLVRTLTDTSLSPGRYQVVWNGLDGSGNPQATGLYICRLVVGKAVFSKKMLLVK